MKILRLLLKIKSLLKILPMFIICSSLVATGCYHNKSKVINEMNDKADTKKIFHHNNIKIRYSDKGNGEVLLLIHGFAASSYTWRYLEESLYSNYRIISIDLKGFGLSDKPLDHKYSAEDQVDIILNFIEENKLSNITLIGHSFGGAIALLTYFKVTEKNNDLIKKLILIDSASYKQDFPTFISVLRAPLLNNLLLSILPSSINAKHVLQESFFNDDKISEEMIKEYGNYLDLPGAHHALIQTAQQLIPDNIDSITSKYNAISIPVLIIWGKEDEIIPLTIGEKLHMNMPNSTFMPINECGHIPHEECPDETINIILKFLGSGID